MRVVRKELQCGMGRSGSGGGNTSSTTYYSRGGWSWIRWYERRELRRRYGDLYGRWIEFGVEEDGEDGVVVKGNIIATDGGVDDCLDKDENKKMTHEEGAAVDTAASTSTNKGGALTIPEYQELRAIEDGTIDDELTVSDILLFRAMVHSKRQKQGSASSSADSTANSTSTGDSQYRLTRFLKRMITSEEDVDEEYTKLLSYLEKKEVEDALLRLKEEEREKKKQRGVHHSSELAVVVSMETIIQRGSVSLFSERGCIFEAALKGLRSKCSILEGLECVILEASIQDCLGLEYVEDRLPNVVFSRCNVGGSRDETCKKINLSDADILLPIDLARDEDNSSDALPWSHYDSPLLDVCFTINPPGEHNASLVLVFEKTQLLLNCGFDWPRQCKEAFSIQNHQRGEPMTTDQAFWEDLSIAYINSWESTKKSLAAKAEKALEKQRKLDVDVTVYSPVVQISDGIGTTLSMDFGRAILSTEQLAGVFNRGNDHHEDVTPKKRNTTTPLLPRSTPYRSDSDDSFHNIQQGYLFTPNNRPSTFSAPDPLAESQGSLDISNIFGTPNDTSSLNGSFSALSFDSSQKRRRGWSIGNSKLFSVAEDEEAAAVDIGESEVELMKCFYDYYHLRLEAVHVSISTQTISTNVFELPLCEARIAKSTIPSDANLCKIRISCMIDHVQMNVSRESILGLNRIHNSMKVAPVKNSTTKYYSGSQIFPTMQLPAREPISDDESSVNEEEFLDAISEFQPDDAGEWFDQHWAVDEDSIGTFTYSSFARTPSRRHRFPSISEVSSADEEDKMYLSAENLLQLDESLEDKRQRLKSYSQMGGGEEDSFHSAISLDNHDELVQAIQDDIKKCE